MEVPSTAATESTKSSGTYPLKEEEEIALYEAKCEDLGRKSTDVQKERFLHTLRSRCPSRIFDLAESGIGPVAMMVLEEVLLKYPQYSVLKLASNTLGDKGTTYLASFFRRGGSNVVGLDLRSNNIGPAGATDLFTSLMHNNTLTFIDLSSLAGANRNHIGSAATTFAEFLVRNEVLTSINLDSNSIALEGLTSIVHALACYNSSLTELELSSNSFGSEGATLIGALLPNTQLRVLGFSRNDIGDRGAVEIARGLFEVPNDVKEELEKKRQEEKEKRKKERERLGLPEKDDDDSDDIDDFPDDEGGVSGGRSGGRSRGGPNLLDSAQLATTQGAMDAMAMQQAPPYARMATDPAMAAQEQVNLAAYFASQPPPAIPPSAGRQARQRIEAVRKRLKEERDAKERLKQLAKAKSQATKQMIKDGVKATTLQPKRRPVARGGAGARRGTAAEEEEAADGRSSVISNTTGMSRRSSVANLDDPAQLGRRASVASLSGQRRGSYQQLPQDVVDALSAQDFEALGTLADPATMTDDELSEMHGSNEQPLDELYASLVPPPPPPIKPKPVRKVRRIQGVFELNPTGETVEHAIQEALVPIAEADDEEDTQDEDVDERGIARLESITLSSNNISEKGAKVLAVALTKNRFLKTLDLSQNKINALGGQAVGEMIEQNETMTVLLLSSCKVGGTGGMHIGRALQRARASALTTLDLSNNGIMDEGAIAIAEGLARNQALQLVDLNLAQNNITDRGGVALGSALEKNRTVQRLNIQSNEFEDATVSALISALRTNNVVTSIDLRYNNSSHILIMALDKLLEENIRQRKETQSARLAEQVERLRADVQRESEMRDKREQSRRSLRERCQTLIDKRQELEDVKKRCADEENRLLNEIDNATKLVYTLGDETNNLVVAISKERGDGSYQTNTLTMQINRVTQQRQEAERKRISTVREMQLEGIQDEEEEEEEKEASPLDEKKPEEGEGEGEAGEGEGEGEGQAPSSEAPPEDKHLTIAQIMDLRAQFEIDVAESSRRLDIIKKWTAAQQAALKKAKATKKWEPGPPLPFEFLPKEEQDQITTAREAAEKQKKDDELKMLLGGGSSSTPSATPQSAKSTSSKSSKSSKK